MKAQAELLIGLMTHKQDPLLNISTVAAALGKSHPTIRRWIETGKMIAQPWPSGGYKVRRSELERWLNSTHESE